jgi:hypothetical protein
MVDKETTHHFWSSFLSTAKERKSYFEQFSKVNKSHAAMRLQQMTADLMPLNSNKLTICAL